MIRSSVSLARSLALLVMLGLALIPLHSQMAAGEARSSGSLDLSSPAGGFEPLVVHSGRNDLLPALRAVPLKKLNENQSAQPAPLALPKAILARGIAGPAASQPQVLGVAQSAQSLQPQSMPGPLFSFDGVSNLFGGWPPDTQGDIGSDYYVQWINLHLAIWQIDRVNQTASLVYGPAAGSTLFSDFGGVCEYNNDGDPITLYDPLAERWFMSQFALPNFPNGPFYQCVAVSQTSNPTASWYRYEFQMPVNKMNDYPKFGVWPDAYYMTVNQFTSGSLSWGGAGVAALERQAMLAGQSARMVYFDLYTVNSAYGGMLPADFDGLEAPPAGAPGYFMEWDDGRWIGPQDALRLWEFHVDWNNLAQSTFGLAGEANSVLPTMDVDTDLCGYYSCIPQPNTSARLDVLSDRLMYRLQYRNFGAHEVLVTNHTVDVDGNDRAGVHWFELRKSGADWELFQEGIFSPDSDGRWMGSAAMDRVGNIGLGYSVSSATTYPSVRYTGRLAGDPAGTMPQGEQSLVEGGGSQIGSYRWGDYSMLAVDPLDDCTFWYTQEYLAVTGFNTWKTRIGAFRFPNCTPGPSGILTGIVRDSSTGLGIAQARVEVTLGSGQMLSTLAAADGQYGIYLPVGSYLVAASAFGYQMAAANVVITEDSTTVQDFALLPAPRHTVSGRVYDAKTGWALYARISISGGPLPPLWTDPQSGEFSIALPEGYAYTFTVQPFVGGYLPQSVTVDSLTVDVRQDFPLQVDIEICQAPGYQFSPTTLVNYHYGFEQSNNGFTAQGATSWAWGAPTSGPLAAYLGANVWATNLAGNYSNAENGYLNFPLLDLPSYPEGLVLISWQQWLVSQVGYDKASLQVSKDSGATWQTVYGPVSGPVSPAWEKIQVVLDSSYATSGFRARFYFISDSSITAPGWYVDEVRVSLGQCIVPQGGLVVGNVYDQNTGLGLVGAEVSHASGMVVTVATPEDEAVADGFYTMFLLQGTQILTATKSGGYQPVHASLVAPRYTTVRQDFYLPVGRLALTPTALAVSLPLGSSLAAPLNLENQGAIPAAFEWRELNKGLVPFGPIEQPNFVNKPFRQNFPDTSQIKLPASPAAAPLAAGAVIRSWTPQGVQSPWGVAYDLAYDTLWVSSPGPGWNGQDAILEFRLDGAPTGRSYSHSPPHTYGPADLAVNWHTGKIWVMNINTGVANCIYEVDPDVGYTGASICPGGGAGFGVSQRGLAYDPSTDTWFAGGWNDLMIYRFDSSGTMLGAVNVGLAISGLAYNPQTQHLFVMVNADPNPVYVLDVANDYALVGQFNIGQGFEAYAGSGLEIDCSGNLWAVDQKQGRVVQFESGETADLCQLDVPWVSELPESGSLPGLSSLVTQVTFDASMPQVDQPGVYRARLLLIHDTPYYLPSIPLTMTVTAPASWGKLSGMVESLGYCDLGTDPAYPAQVTIQSSGGAVWSIETAQNGAYQRWLDSAGSPYLVTVSLTGYQPQKTTVIMTPGGVVVQHIALHWLQPCLSIDTTAISLTLVLGTSQSVPVRIDNLGYGAANFNWLESLVGTASSWLQPQLIRLPGAVDGRSAPEQVGLASPLYLSGSASILLDEGFESAQVPPPGWQPVVHSANTWSLGSFAPHSGNYNARVLWEYNQDEWLLSPEMNLATGVLSFWSYGSLYWCRDVEDNCDLNVWIVVGEVGGGDDIFVGAADDDWLNTWTWSQSAFNLAPLLPGGPVRIGFQYLGSDGAEVALDDILLDGLEVVDMPWLSESPQSGSIPALSGSQVVDVTLNAGAGLDLPGIYTAILNLQTNDPVISLWSIPVTLTVTLPDYNYKVLFPLLLKLIGP